ncbi:MAG: hypothetical protein AAB441_00035 [Patescibacteria group bacterium]
MMENSKRAKKPLEYRSGYAVTVTLLAALVYGYQYILSQNNYQINPRIDPQIVHAGETLESTTTPTRTPHPTATTDWSLFEMYSNMARVDQITKAVSNQLSNPEKIVHIQKVCEDTEVYLTFENFDHTKGFKMTSESSATLLKRDMIPNSTDEVYFIIIAKHVPANVLNMQNDGIPDSNNHTFDGTIDKLQITYPGETNKDQLDSIQVKPVAVVPLPNDLGQVYDMALVVAKSTRGVRLPDSVKELGLDNVHSWYEGVWTNIIVKHRPTLAGVDHFVTTAVDMSRIKDYVPTAEDPNKRPEDLELIEMYPKDKTIDPTMYPGSSSGTTCADKTNVAVPVSGFIGMVKKIDPRIDQYNWEMIPNPKDLKNILTTQIAQFEKSLLR